MSKVMRISSGTEKVLEDLKAKLEAYYKSKIGVKIDLKEDDIIQNALIAELEKANKLL